MSQSAGDNAKESQSAVRQFFTQQLTALGNLLGQLKEPWASEFRKLKDQYDSVLKSLPPSEQAPAALEANSQLTAVFSSLVSAQSVITYLSNEIIGLGKKHDESASQLVTYQQRCTDFDAKLKNGDLVERQKVTELCSASEKNGLEAGRKEVRDEVAKKEAAAQVIVTRKELLASAQLPVPADALLAGSDDEFKARQEKVATRTADLRKKGLSLNSKTLIDAAWADDAAFAGHLSLIDSVLSERGGSRVNPLAGGAAPADPETPGGIF